MAILIIALLIAIPIAELYVGSLVVDQLGLGPALLLLLAAAIVGLLVIRSAWRRRPRGADNALLLVAGLLLLFPGYVTDVLGWSCYCPRCARCARCGSGDGSTERWRRGTSRCCAGTTARDASHAPTISQGMSSPVRWSMTDHRTNPNKPELE